MDETLPSARAVRVLFAASEVFPLAKTGGLADVCGALPNTLAELGLDVRVMMPGYPQALDLVEEKRSVPVDVPDGRIVAGRMPNSDLQVLLYDCPALYARRGGLYQDADGNDWSDNDRRFGLFCRAAAAVALGRSALNWRPRIVHCNDWHTGLVPALLRANGKSGGKSAPRTVFTIHNLAFQGNFPLAAFAGLGLPQEMLSPEGIEFYGQISFLKAGIRYGDRLTTVSPSYAREILTDEHGCGFQGLLRARAGQLVGILNGIDYSVWDPANDAELPCRYSAEAPQGKAACKAALRQELGLSDEREAAPLLIYVNRLTHQKMADVVLEAVPQLVANGGQVVVHGEGERRLEDGFRAIAAAHPRQVAARLGYQEALAHRLQAAADLSLTPSRFEPCGLTTMYAMRYGAVPVTRPVGGLRDTVEDAGAGGLDGSGFVFDESTARGLADCVGRATQWYGKASAWAALRRRAMERDFGWVRSARRYLEIYLELLAEDIAPRPRLRPVPRAEPPRVGA